ncbi:hypothetical protein NHX12_027693 [Muraenolepis orangiensis]|uniref:Uncharacterized protein n=1 Tax=Muraenolepis orangiensis TaxID=630683 RepID=A0A9Q0EG06_9TELE|nr:hypothetical protein NHX12_027693 [Muraenolepis orangiensis]
MSVVAVCCGLLRPPRGNEKLSPWGSMAEPHSDGQGIDFKAVPERRGGCGACGFYGVQLQETCETPRPDATRPRTRRPRPPMAANPC